jgi:hypothetical protein
LAQFFVVFFVGCFGSSREKKLKIGLLAPAKNYGHTTIEDLFCQQHKKGEALFLLQNESQKYLVASQMSVQ